MEIITNKMGRVRPVPEGEHNAGRNYRMLSIVYSKDTNKSYISKQDVPAGINIDNKIYWQVFGNGKFVDNAIINVSYLENSIVAHTLAEAISMVAKEDRRPGILLAFYEVITEVNESDRWNIYQFKGSSINDWNKQKYWHSVYQNGSAFKGWFFNSTDLVKQYPVPSIGDYAYVGNTLEESIIWRCNIDGTWTNTTEKTKNGIQVILGGNVSVSSNNTWIVNGIDTGLPAKGDTGNIPLLRKNDSLEVIQISYDNGETYESLISYNTLKPIIKAVAVTGAEGTQATVENVGTNVNPIFKFTIPRGQTGLQGPQGNTGANVDYPYELINNLETDDATKGLSAAQGVILNNKSIELSQEIKSIDYKINGAEANINDFIKVANGYIEADGDIRVGSNYDYYIIHNFDFKNISVVCSASDAMSAIAFYNSEEIGANTLISNILGVGFTSTTPYTAIVPVECKTIVISNRTGEEITVSLNGEKGIVDKFIPLVSSRNLIDKNASGVLVGYYVVGTTVAGGGTYDGNTTDYIPVLSNKQYSFFTGYKNGVMRFITYYDSEKNVISYEQNVVIITTPINASYVRITITNPYWNNCSFGVGILGNVTVHKSVINPKNIETIPSNGYVHFVGTLLQNRTEILLPIHLGYGYNATLLISNVFDTIRFGFGESEYNGGFVEINATEIKIYSYYSTLVLVQTYEHGLTIGERTYIQLIKDKENSTKIILCSMGNSFETFLNWNPRGTLFVHYLTGNPIAYKVGYYPTMLNKPIWVFGDSYYGNDPNRFVGYLFENNQNDWLINNKPGIASPASLIDLKTLLYLNGKPKYVLWGLGMNDPQDADENTPNAVWLQNIQEVIQLCEDNGIIPILATIPSALAENVIPNVLYYHDAKSKWVRNSGYRYIDFAASVGAQANGIWYPGCKYTDIHPSIMGAKMMYEQCLVDFPELASKGF